ncbi:ATP-binding protein [Streptomyces capparidis]
MPVSPPSPGTAPPAASSAPEEPPVRKLYRSAEGRMLGGVARGLAGHLGLPVLWVRGAFLVLVPAQGMGLLLYAVFWFVVPLGVGGVELKDPKVGHGRWRLGAHGHERKKLLAVVAFIAGAAVLLDNLSLGIAGPYAGPFLVFGAGVALVWRQADNARRARWVRMGRSRKGLVPVLRSAAGVVLVCLGVSGFIVVQGSLRHLGAVLQATLAILSGIVLLAGPYLIRMAQDLSAERRMRIRAQERAEVAAHVHDSVLHTLTLIQRHADDPREVAKLARAQERELRAWLYRPATEPAGAADGDAGQDAGPATLADAVRAAAAEVEDAHGVPVEVVCVGDCPLDERLGAQAQAAREAMVNAAKYGGGAPVQVYAEVEERSVSVFVRDRGPGFDPEQVPADRMGVRESIIGRMRRNGGRAVLRGVPGGGTEVELEMERVRS